MERDILTVPGSRRRDLLTPWYPRRQIHGKPLDPGPGPPLKRLVERLPGVFLQPGADLDLRRAPRKEKGEEANPAAAAPPTSAAHRSVPTPVLVGEIEASLSAPVERPTPKRILRRDDASADGSADGAVSGPVVEVGGIYAGTCSDLANIGAFVSLDSGGRGLLHRSKCTDAAGAQYFPAKGDRLFVRVLQIRDDGKLEFSTLGLDPGPPARRRRTGATKATARGGAGGGAGREAGGAVPARRGTGSPEVIDDCGGEILLPNFIKATNGPRPDYRALASRGSRCSSNASPASAQPGPASCSARAGTPDGVRGQAAAAGGGAARRPARQRTPP